MLIIAEYRQVKQRIFCEGGQFLCPKCKKGMLLFRDYCKRSLRKAGGEREWLEIPRHQCDNCKSVHRMLPDKLLPYKHYEQPVIRDSLNGRLDLDEAGNAPSSESVKRWSHWLMASVLQIEGAVKSVAHRELGFGEELLKYGGSLLDSIRRMMPMDWLATVMRIIYNSGGSLPPFYG